MSPSAMSHSDPSHQPKISVLINNYNYATYLRACIDSVLVQDYPNFEVVVVDDGSTDGSKEIIESYGDRIVPILKKNGGQASSFNAGFESSTGEILFLLDSDDAFLPGKLWHVAAIYAENAVDWCFDRVTTSETDTAPTEIRTTAVDKRDALRRGRFPSLPAPTSGLSFRRGLLSQILPMSVATDVVLSDNYIKFASAFLGRGVIVETPLTFQRIHASNRYTGTSKAKTLRPKIMIATGLELARRYDGLQRLGRNLVAGGLAERQTPWAKLRDEVRETLKDGPFHENTAPQMTMMVVRKRLSKILQGKSSR